MISSGEKKANEGTWTVFTFGPRENQANQTMHANSGLRRNRMENHSGPPRNLCYWSDPMRLCEMSLPFTADAASVISTSISPIKRMAEMTCSENRQGYDKNTCLLKVSFGLDYCLCWHKKGRQESSGDPCKVTRLDMFLGPSAEPIHLGRNYRRWNLYRDRKA
jgi:hypothetical protein